MLVSFCGLRQSHEKAADLVMLEHDIMTMPEGEIPSMKVLMTMVGGKIVYQQEGFKLAMSRNPGK